MREEPVPIEKVTTLGANSHIWSERPILRVRQGRTYHGRVLIEVWDTDTHLVFNDEALVKRALVALQDPVPVSGSDVLLTDDPATGDVPGQIFLGRVVVEVWDDQEIVGISGSDPRLLERARKMLQEVG